MTQNDLFNQDVQKDDSHKTRYYRDELEAYKQLRTNLEFSSIDTELQVITLTSADSAEAKTTTAINLAKVMAMQKSRVLLIDCDLRIPDVHKLLKLSNKSGVTNALINNDLDKTTLAKYVQVVKVSNTVNGLFVMTSGSTIPNPLEVLNSKRFKSMIEFLRANFDTIIIDAPPVLPVADAIPISHVSDGVLFCVASNQTNRDRAQDAIVQLKRAKINVLGTVLTMVQADTNGYYQYYYRYSKAAKKPTTLGQKLKAKRKQSLK